MFKKKKPESKITDQTKEKTIPAFLRDDYPYKAIGEPVIDLDTLESGVVYEIKCHQCEMSVRSQGHNIRATYERLKESGCIGCGNKELVIKRVDMSNARAVEKND